MKETSWRLNHTIPHQGNSSFKALTTCNSRLLGNKPSKRLQQASYRRRIQAPLPKIAFDFLLPAQLPFNPSGGVSGRVLGGAALQHFDEALGHALRVPGLLCGDGQWCHFGGRGRNDLHGSGVPHVVPQCAVWIRMDHS